MATAKTINIKTTTQRKQNHFVNTVRKDKRETMNFVTSVCRCCFSLSNILNTLKPNELTNKNELSHRKKITIQHLLSTSLP